MRKIAAKEAARLGLPTHEHHDLPGNKIILDTLARYPGAWFHCAWNELSAIGTNVVKLESLREDASFRSWTLHDHIVNGYQNGGVFLMRDMLE